MGKAPSTRRRSASPKTLFEDRERRFKTCVLFDIQTLISETEAYKQAHAKRTLASFARR